jgi:hypothetical protein
MTSTGVLAERPRVLTEQQADVQRAPAAALRRHDAFYLTLFAVVQLSWLAALAYGLVRLVA